MALRAFFWYFKGRPENFAVPQSSNDSRVPCRTQWERDDRRRKGRGKHLPHPKKKHTLLVLVGRESII